MLIENSNFILPEIPNFHPELNHYDRLSFWKEQKRRAIEGYWVGGKWMPGPLYNYVNFIKILIESEGISQQLSLPYLRDIDWEDFLYYEECRGFSGFELDTKFTCHRDFGPDKDIAILFGRITEEQISAVTYISAREYLRKYHGRNLGKPLYKNNASHFISIQSRGGGKSYGCVGKITHNFLYDGAIDYDQYLFQKQSGIPLSSDTIVGAIDTKYSGPLINKVKKAFEHLPGSYKTSNGIYPSPLAVSFDGSLASGKEYTSRNGSFLRHRTFKDNPFAANSTRANLCILDEIGFMDNIEESWGAIEALQASKEHKNLVIWALGTGGLVSGKAALYAEKIFRNPDKFGALVFNDVFENRGKIGYFVPYTKTLNAFKEGPNKITNDEKALKAVMIQREKKKANTISYNTEVINGPIVPSEAFLSAQGGYFDTVKLKNQESDVVAGHLKVFMDASYKGVLEFNTDNKVIFRSVQDAEPIRDFPLLDNADKKGCLELISKPPEYNPRNTFILGADVVDKALATTNSITAVYVMNRLTRRLVAYYAGRTEDPNDFYELCRKLCIYYNGTLMYEQNLVGMYTYFSNKNCTHLLADTPHHLRNADTFREGTNTSKGIHATTKVNIEARKMIKSWLMESLGNNTDSTILNTIFCPATLKELISWNVDGNFDRVSALGMLLWHDNTLYRKSEEEKDDKPKPVPFTESDYFKKMGLFKKQDNSINLIGDFNFNN